MVHLGLGDPPGAEADRNMLAEREVTTTVGGGAASRESKKNYCWGLGGGCDMFCTRTPSLYTLFYLQSRS